MVNSFLFGNQSSSQSKYLVEFKAGKMQKIGTTVNPINKKGLVYLYKTDENLMHFCWKDRQSGQVEDDLIIFPDETEFKKVSQCTTGRVFVLIFKLSNERFFYWMQEPKDDKDDDICKKVNEFLNNPSRSSRSINILNHSLTGLPDSDLNNLIDNVSSQQLMQILSRVNGLSSTNQAIANFLNPSLSRTIRNSGSSGSSRSKNSSSNNSGNATTASNNNEETSTTTLTQSPSTNTPTTTPVSNTNAGIQLSDLQNIISGLAGSQGSKKEANVDLAAVVSNSEALKSLLGNKEFMDKVKELIPDTSEVKGMQEKTLPEQVTATIESVQFKSALGTFNSALQSGLLGPLIKQFNLSDACVEAANKGDLEEFVKAMESSSKIKKSEDTDKKDPIGDSEMADEF